MSAFSQFGAPGCPGPSTKDILALIDAYDAMQAKLQEHVQHTCTDASDVHGVKTQLASKANNSDVYDKTEVYTKSEVDTALAGKADSTDVYSISQVNSALAGKADDTVVSTLAEAVGNCATTAAMNTALAGKADSANVYAKSAADAKFVAKADLSDSRKVTVDNELEFEFKLTTLQYAGTGAANDTGTHGIYVVGKIADVGDGLPKPSRVYIKYVNSHPFDALVDIAVTHDEHDKASIMAVVSRSDDEDGEGNHYWNGLRFHVLHVTDNQSHDNYYLGLSADNVAESVIAVYAAGVNFIPLGEEGAPSITALGDCVDHTTRIPDAATSALLVSGTLAIEGLSLNEITDTEGDAMFSVSISNGKKYLEIGSGADDKIRFRARPTAFIGTDPEHMTEHAFITDEEAENFCSTPLGGIIMWPKFIVHEEGGQVIGREALDPPEGWVVAYGGTVAVDPDLPDSYPDLADLAEAGILQYTDATHKWVQLPKMDYAIMKAEKPTFSNIVPEIPVAPDVAQLATDVANLTAQLASEIELREDADTAHSEAINTINGTTIPAAQAAAEATAKDYTDAQVGQTVAAEQAARVGADTTILDYLEDIPVASTPEGLPQTATTATEYEVGDHGVVFNGTTIVTYEVTAVTMIEADLYDITWEPVNA